MTSKGGLGVYGSAGINELKRNYTLSGKPALQVNASFNAAPETDVLDSSGKSLRRESRSVDARDHDDFI